MQKTICIDFDGVLAHYDGWRGEDHLGGPIEGMKELIDNLRLNHNYTIIIYSCRSFVKIDKWCKLHDIYYDYINMNPDFPVDNIGKPAADVYLDDRAITFNPKDVKAGLEGAIVNFMTWREKENKHSLLFSDAAEVIEKDARIKTQSLNSRTVSQ
jgi:hypothetical protein